MDRLILVLYVDVRNVPLDSIESHVGEISGTLFPKSVFEKLEATVFVMTTRETETRIECINPNYVIDKDLQKSFIEKLDNLNKNVSQLLDERS
jgi:hypothetical protein